MPLRSAFLAALLAVPLVAAGQTATDVTLTASDGNTVAIDRDDYGVPHITADTEAAVFFGQGFATAQDRLFQLETFWRTATGRLAELQGSAALAQDQGIRTVYYTPAERAAQFTQLTPRLQTMISSYVDGINAYIDSTSANPSAYLPGEYAAGGFRDFTRIAASDPIMWRDVFLNNREAVLEILSRFSKDLTALRRTIRRGEGEVLEKVFTRTRAIRRGIVEAKQDKIDEKMV